MDAVSHELEPLHPLGVDLPLSSCRSTAVRRLSLLAKELDGLKMPANEPDVGGTSLVVSKLVNRRRDPRQLRCRQAAEKREALSVHSSVPFSCITFSVA